jgi:hypothetical protein
VYTAAAALSAPATGLERVHLGQTVGSKALNYVADFRRRTLQNPDPLGLERLDGATSHPGTNYAVDLVTGQMIHGVARPVIVVGVAVLYDGYFIGLRIQQREIRGRAKMFMNGIF